jgi:hypothetical protein
MKTTSLTGTIRLAAFFAALLTLLMPYAVFAQTAGSLTTTVPAITADPTLTLPASDGRPLTPEAPPIGTVTATQETTQQTTQETLDPRETTETTQETSETTETTELDLPEPELPVLDIGTTDGSPNEEILTETECVDPDSVETTILTPVVGNQIKVALMALLGAILGAILWVAGSALIGSARNRGEIMRVLAMENEAMETKRVELLAEAKAALEDTLSGVLKQTGNKISVDHDRLEQYCRAAADIEIIGSEKTLQAHKNLLGLLSAHTPPAPEDFDTARAALLESVQDDMTWENPHKPQDRKQS